MQDPAVSFRSLNFRGAVNTAAPSVKTLGDSLSLYPMIYANASKQRLGMLDSMRYVGRVRAFARAVKVVIVKLYIKIDYPC